ncbi:MAG TPA: hypothetical protein VGE02_02340, partial [Gemmatimonadales bacterium]
HVDPSVKDCEVRFASNLTQGAFHRFVREFGTLSAFRQAASPATLGRGRVLAGVEGLVFQIDEWAPAWNDTFVHPDEHHDLGAGKKFPKLKLRVGVTDDVDVGASYAVNPEANYGWLGVDGKYRVLSEDAGDPVSVAVRGAYTKTLYVSDMDMHALTADVSVGRSFWRPLRAYVGAGADAAIARERSSAVALASERVVVPHGFVGAELSVGRRMSVGAEYTVGARPSVQLQVAGIAF